MKTLTNEEFIKFSPPYYLYGIEQDEIVVNQVEIGDTRLLANAQVNYLYFDEKEGRAPHFPAVHAFKWAFHLLALYLRYKKKPDSQYKSLVLRESTLKCKGFITNREFSISANMFKRRELKNGVLYSFKVDFDDGKFFLSCTIMVC